MALVTFNVGGTMFQTQRSTLQGVPNTRLSDETLLAENFVKDKQHYFFDRDPQVFSYILNFYRTGELHLPSGVCSSSTKKELNYWMIPENLVSECCLKELYDMNSETKVVRELDELFQNEITDSIMSTNMTSAYKRFRHNLWMFLEYPSSSLAAKIWEMFYYTLIIMSTLLFLLNSMESLRLPDANMEQKCNISKKENLTLYLFSFQALSNVEMKHILTRPLFVIDTLDVLLTIVFTFEFISRFTVCPRKCQFFKSFLNVLDLCFLLCKYPATYMEKYSCLINHEILWSYAILKTLTELRLLRLFRIGRSFKGFTVMIMAIKSSSNELFLMICSFLCLTVLFATSAYMTEMHAETFQNAFYACWWAMITMTTVGYGDILPITPLGRVLGALCAVTGLVVLTLPIAVIGTNFSEYYNVNRNRDMFVSERKKECPIGKSTKGLKGNDTIGETKVTKF